MENQSKDIGKLVAQSKKLQEINTVKQTLEKTLTELTVCNNVAILSKKPKIFDMKVLKTSCKVVGTTVPAIENYQTLIITVQNVSKNLVFNSMYWQFCVNLNDRTQSTWNLNSTLAPGQEDKFCCPLTKTFPVEKVSISLKFVTKFESKTYTRSFGIREFVVDALHCLDPGAFISENSTLSFVTPESNSVNFYPNNDVSNTSFPSITRFMLKLDTTLKDMFVKDILLCDSVHRGFSTCLEELSRKSEISVFYEGSRIDVNLNGKNDNVLIQCLNPTVLSAVKASILRRLVTIEGITVEASNDEHLEKIHEIKLKLATFESDCDSDSLDASDLMELYLGLRDISESIRFSVIQLIE